MELIKILPIIITKIENHHLLRLSNRILAYKWILQNKSSKILKVMF